MNVVYNSNDLKKLLLEAKNQSLKIGFVPTMGALHNGHLSLVKAAKEKCDVCVVSIFVNPTQFNNPDDLKTYPRTIEADVKLLDNYADIVYVPSVEDVYPEKDERIFDFGDLDKVMEGEHRPGHFNGVAQVVSRFFALVEPDYAFFGEKDFQQLAIIRAMVKLLDLKVEIVPMPIVREESGLALSSRNQRLTDFQRSRASFIYETLSAAKKEMKTSSVEATIRKVVDRLNAADHFDVEYFSIVDGNTLQDVKQWSDSPYIVGCIAVYCGDVRLIDNIVFKEENLA